MPKRQRRTFTAEQKVALLRLHLLEKKPVSDICEEHNLSVNLFYSWRRCCVTKSSLFPHPRDGDHPPEANDPARFFYDSSHELSPELLFSVSLTCDVLTFPLSVS